MKPYVDKEHPFALPDWEYRLRAGESIVPRLDLTLPDFDYETAEAGLAVFESLKLADVPGNPTVGESTGQWMKDFAYQWLGAQGTSDGELRRFASEGLLLVAKKNGKSTYGALLLFTQMLFSRRPGAEFVVVSPTINVSTIAYRAIEGAIRLDPDLSSAWKATENTKMISSLDKNNKTKLKVMSADKNVAVGVLATGVLVDEMHQWSQSSSAESIVGQLKGSRIARPDYSLLTITTHAETEPLGIWKTTLDRARRVREGKSNAPMLFAGYEWGKVATKTEEWRDRKLWYMTNPNMGYSVSMDVLDEMWEEAQEAERKELYRFASQHLNVQLGSTATTLGWAGAEWWDERAEEGLTWDAVVERSDVGVIGIDAGGLDDIAAIALLGREKGTGRWLHALHCWVAERALRIRKQMAVRVREYAAAGEVTILDDADVGTDVDSIAMMVAALKAKGKLPKTFAVGVDARGMSGLKTALAEIGGMSDKQVVDVPQGWRLHPYIQTFERQLGVPGRFAHGGLRVMGWMVSNVRPTWRGSAISIEKANAPDKIDGVVATINAAAMMCQSPQPVNRDFGLVRLAS